MQKKNIEAEYQPKFYLRGQNIKPGKWTISENKKYLDFLSQNRQKLENQNLRRQFRIYKLMSERIPGRTSDQCRGHHRRMVQIYKTIDRIIQRLKDQLMKRQHKNGNVMRQINKIDSIERKQYQHNRKVAELFQKLQFKHVGRTAVFVILKIQRLKKFLPSDYEIVTYHQTYGDI